MPLCTYWLKRHSTAVFHGDQAAETLYRDEPSPYCRAGQAGKVTFDEFGNAKDILLAILPLATASLGFWYGNQGANAANDAATTANAQAASATKNVLDTQAQLAAVLDQAPPGTLQRAKEVHGEVFAKTSAQGHEGSSGQ